jgi:hypothetical protein
MKIKTYTKNAIRAATLGTLLLAQSNTANADDIFKGVKGPTKWQLDLRESYMQKTDLKGLVTTTSINNDVIKYWSGNNAGLFGFVNVPAYKTIDNGISKSAGFGDIVLGVGPRGKFNLDQGSFNFLSYVGVGVPTGDSKCKPAIGTDRYDMKAGIYTTTLNAKKTLELTTSLDYTRAGKTSSGVRGLDEIAFGAIVGARLIENNLLRIGLGFTSKYKEVSQGDWAHAYAARAVVRITPPKKNWHVELIGEYDVNSRNMSKGYFTMAQLRINM